MKIMYNVKDIVFAGKHDYDKESAEKFASWGGETFSVGVFQWELKTDGKSMKRGKVKVRVVGSPGQKEKVFQVAEGIVLDLDAGQYDGRKTVTV